MPINHAGNTANGNQMGVLRANPPVGILVGRLTNLPIYEVKYTDFRNSGRAGVNLDTVVGSIERNDQRDRAHGYRQPLNHADATGNLPVAPGGGVEYREYFLAANGFAYTGFVRLVADIRNHRLFITPTHYDTWLDNPVAAGNANVNNAIAAAAAGARNAFYLLKSVGAFNELFD